jgi:predicted Zn-dependent protease
MVRRGRRYHEEGKLHSAERALKTATEIDPRNNEAWYFLDRVREEIDGRDREELRHRDIQNEATTEPKTSRGSRLRDSSSLPFTRQSPSTAAL